MELFQREVSIVSVGLMAIAQNFSLCFTFHKLSCSMAIFFAVAPGGGPMWCIPSVSFPSTSTFLFLANISSLLLFLEYSPSCWP